MEQIKKKILFNVKIIFVPDQHLQKYKNFNYYLKKKWLISL
jgi:quinolinate synthase